VVLFAVNSSALVHADPAAASRLARPARIEARLATGILISAYSLAAAASAWGLGRLSRTRSPHGLLIGTLVGGALIVAPMALVPSYELVLTLAVLLGLVAGGSLTLCYTIGGLMVPDGVRTTAFGFFSGAALFGGALSPTVAGLVAHVACAHLLRGRGALRRAGRRPRTRRTLRPSRPGGPGSA